jgi:hypothetical protein
MPADALDQDEVDRALMALIACLVNVEHYNMKRVLWLTAQTT